MIRETLTHKAGVSFIYMNDKEIRNKMYALYDNLGQKFNPSFAITNEERKLIKEIMNEYKDYFDNQPRKIEFYAKKESEWKPYPPKE